MQRGTHDPAGTRVFFALFTRRVTIDDPTAHLIQSVIVLKTMKGARVEGHPPCFLAKYYLSTHLYSTRSLARTHAHPGKLRESA